MARRWTFARADRTAELYGNDLIIAWKRVIWLLFKGMARPRKKHWPPTEISAMGTPFQDMLKEMLVRQLHSTERTSLKITADVTVTQLVERMGKALNSQHKNKLLMPTVSLRG